MFNFSTSTRRRQRTLTLDVFGFQLSFLGATKVLGDQSMFGRYLQRANELVAPFLGGALTN